MTNAQSGCCECRSGEHPDYDTKVVFCVVRDPDEGGFRLRGYLCEEHRVAFCDDGYIVQEVPEHPVPQR